MNRKQKKMLFRIIITAALMVALHFVPVSGYARLALYLIPYLIIGWDILWKAVTGIFHRQVFDENFLMAVATVGAIIIAVTGSGDYVEAIAVMLFYQIGELFQSCAVGKSRRSISQLMDIRPDSAGIESEGQIVQVDPSEVGVGSVIVVRPGERIPIDGIIIEGESSLDTSALTGESLPRSAKAGSEVLSGSINLTGVLRIRTTREFGQSTASKILDLVENAGSRKSRSEAFITRFARVYTPAVCIGALALAVIPPVVRSAALGLPAMWSDWIYRALTFLVISCPCALVISIPLTFFAAIGGAGRAGILVKGSNYLEALSRTDIAVFDKTGTLTEGSFEVAGIHHGTMDDETLLYYAAHAESSSSHPIARSILRAYGRQPDLSRSTDVREISGQGVTAFIDGRTVAAGNSRLMDSLGISCQPCSSVGTVVHIAIDGEYSGHILISDRVKPESPSAIAALKAAGVSRTVMLTGDSDSAARQIAGELDIDEVASQLLPGDKVDKVEALLQSKRDKTALAFVGDGINDAPVLARADIGIAMGALGSDAAIEAADVVLMDDDPGKVSVAIRHARRCMSIVYQNIAFALGVKLICLALGALGITGMWMAIFADVGVMIIAVLNAIRALSVRK
ncbi:MAG: cadmium-translocating P-type ATPase [Ruminococcaceae bacterium]|nr:cadmium-translocating P-type ATPase [Oscillospiraceae bacterium]